MAGSYTSGSASSFSDLLTAITNLLATKGYANAAGAAGTPLPSASRILSKGDIYIRLGYDNTPALFIYGGTGISGANLVNPSTEYCKMASAAAAPIVFPVTYEIFYNDDPEEVYVVISYNGDKYQHLHWGKSDVPDIGASGLWFAASYQGSQSMSGAAGGTGDQSKMYMSATRTGGTATNAGAGYVYPTPYAGISGGYFFIGDNWKCGSIYVGLEGSPAWRTQQNSSVVGRIRWQLQNGPLMQALPSYFNESEVLLPIWITMERASALYTPVAVMRHARQMRIDNVSPGDIITYGTDQWKCFPLYAKNTVQRDGANWTTGAYHSGTVGVALQYRP
mgnify:CR=1 FL=1